MLLFLNQVYHRATEYAEGNFLMIQSGDDDWIIIPIPSGIELRTLYGL